MSTLTRREFMKAFGVGLASLVLDGCRPSQQEPTPTISPTYEIMCYEKVVVVTISPTAITLTPRDQLRACWLSFAELAEKTKSGQNSEPDQPDNDPLGAQLSADHRLALDSLVTAGELDPEVADLVQEAYEAAVYHVWRSNAPITCYEPMVVNFAPTSAQQLVQQSAILAEMSAKGDLDPDTVAIAHQTIQHDLAFEALSREEVEALYQRLIEAHPQVSEIPSFENVDLDETPEIEKAAQFLIDLFSER